MSGTIGYYDVMNYHATRTGCTYCKFKNKFDWKCDSIFGPLKGKPVTAKTTCPLFKREAEGRIR